MAAETEDRATEGATVRKRRHRERMMARGLVPVQIWVPKERRSLVRRLGHLLREGAEIPWAALSDVNPEGETGMKLELLSESLQDHVSEGGYRFRCEANGKAEDGIIVTVEDRDEFPITVTEDGEHLLCLVHLWHKDEVPAEKRPGLDERLLTLNPSMPLSAFGRVGDAYVMFGSLAAESKFSNIVKELETLSENSIEAVGAVSEYLV